MMEKLIHNVLEGPFLRKHVPFYLIDAKFQFCIAFVVNPGHVSKRMPS